MGVAGRGKKEKELRVARAGTNKGKADLEFQTAGRILSILQRVLQRLVLSGLDLALPRCAPAAEACFSPCRLVETSKI